MVTDLEEITVRQTGTKGESSVHKDQTIPRNRGNRKKERKYRKYCLNIPSSFPNRLFKSFT